MEPQAALKMLYDVTTQVAMPKFNHDKCLEAAVALQTFIAKHTPATIPPVETTQT